MTNLETFFYWINERHNIYLKRQTGEPAPWTNDPILQEYKFTNPFRENDKTTAWCRENIRCRYHGADLIFVLALFRQTGTIKSGQIINELFENAGYDVTPGSLVFEWDPFSQEMADRQAQGDQIFTGAYMVTGRFPGAEGKPKIMSLCEHALQPVWKNRHELYRIARETRSLQKTCEAFTGWPGWGGNHFMAYEVVCDLRYTSVLQDAVDIMAWANPGPGAQRGLSRIHGGKINNERGGSSRPKDQCVAEMRELLAISPKHLGPHVPPLEMREIEHSLCEYDKYCRVLQGEGRPRSKYNGKGL